MGGWRTRQALSYFAVRLPHGWWLVGVDVQLKSDIDEPQLDYFRRVAEQMEEDARIILCTAEPHWIYEAKYRQFDPTVTNRNLDFLEQRIFGRRIEVYLAGDLHHYRRHEDAEGHQKITAGGGGAFLYPTHADGKEVDVLPGGFAHQASFPAPAESRRLAWRNLAFPVLNLRFGIATGLLYFVLGWAVQADVSRFGLTEIGGALGVVAVAIIRSQIAALWGALMLSGFYFFTDTHSPRYKLAGGLLHGTAHLLAAFFIGWGATYFAVHGLGFPFGSWQQLLATGALLLAGGYLAGALIMGIYLLVSLNVFGRQSNEAFSSLHCEDYKSWLRLRVMADGSLGIYPIQLRRVPRRWKEAAPSAGAPSLLVPDDPRATPPALVERPVILPRRGVQGAR